MSKPSFDMKPYYWFFGLLAIVSAGVVLAQAMVNGPVKADRELAERLRNVNEQIQMYAQKHNMAPTDLEQVASDHAGVTYKRLSNTDYELCGTFQTTSKARYKASPVPGNYIDTTAHPKGYYCYKAIVSREWAEDLPLR